MNENYVNIAGFVGTDVETKIVGEGISVATFRIASTPRRWNNKDRSWVDGETNWYTVNAWRMLGRNCNESLSKGDPVTVYGKLSSQVWTDAEGVRHQTMVVDAAAVGHDLNRGCSSFERTFADAADDQGLAESNVAMGVGGPQVSSDGETLDDLVSTLEDDLLDQAS